MTSREAVALGRFRPCAEQQPAKASAVLQAKYVYPRGIACVAYEGDNGYAALSQRVVMEFQVTFIASIRPETPKGIEPRFSKASSRRPSAILTATPRTGCQRFPCNSSFHKDWPCYCCVREVIVHAARAAMSGSNRGTRTRVLIVRGRCMIMTTPI